MKDEDLIGKTIKSVSRHKIKGYDDKYVLIEFTDGTNCVLIGTYGTEWTGQSIDEYSTDVWISSLEERGWERED